MAGGMCIFTDIFAGKCTAAALEVKTFHQIQLELFINMLSYDKGVGALPVSGKDIVASGSVYFRKIKLVDLFSCCQLTGNYRERWWLPLSWMQGDTLSDQ